MRLVAPAATPELDDRVDQHHEGDYRDKQKLSHVEIQGRQDLLPGGLLKCNTLAFERRETYE